MFFCGLLVMCVFLGNYLSRVRAEKSTRPDPRGRRQAGSAKPAGRRGPRKGGSGRVDIFFVKSTWSMANLTSGSRPIDALRKGKAMADSPPVAVAADASGSADATETADDAHFTSAYGFHKPGTRWTESSEKGGWKWVRRLSVNHPPSHKARTRLHPYVHQAHARRQNRLREVLQNEGQENQPADFIRWALHPWRSQGRQHHPFD
jgi:hypothetical protein